MPHWKHYSQTAMPHGDDAGAPGHDVLPSAPRKVHSHDDLLHSSARPTSQLQSGSIQGIGQYVASRKAAVPRPNCPAYVMCDVSRPSTSNAYDSEGFTGARERALGKPDRAVQSADALWNRTTSPCKLGAISGHRYSPHGLVPMTAGCHASSFAGFGTRSFNQGLYVDQPVRLHLIEDDRRPHPSALMDTMRPQEPKETHTAAVEVNEQTGNKLINEYEIIGELGRGEHGKVKLGIHGITGRKVAIKIVRRHSKSRRLGKAANSEDNVKKEVAILKKARHPNIVSLLEVIDDPSQLKAYIVLEYVENGEIIWRRRGLEEISIVDRKRIEREKKGLPESHSFIVESLQFVEAARHLRAQSRRTGDLTNLDNSTTNSGVQAWSLEHGGDAEEVDTEGGEAGTSEGANFVDDIVSAIKNSEYWTCYQTLRRIRFTGSSSAGAFDDVCGSDNDDFLYVPCLTMEQILVAFRDAVLGLEYLHFQGIIHRDIKPANLLVSKNKHIKISDFGVSYLGRPIHNDWDKTAACNISYAEKLDAARELSKTVGTPAFYAPELCCTGSTSYDASCVPKAITAAIDIWSLGVTLYAMVYGRLPFTYDEHSLFHNIVHSPVFISAKRLVPVEPKPTPRCTAFGRQISNGLRFDDELLYENIEYDLRDLIQKLLVKDPKKRITLQEIKRHPWVLRGIECPAAWLLDTDPARQSEGRKIEVSREEVTRAVTRMPFIQRIKHNVAKLGNTIFGNARSKDSSVTKVRAEKEIGIFHMDCVRSNSAGQSFRPKPPYYEVRSRSPCLHEKNGCLAEIREACCSKRGLFKSHDCESAVTSSQSPAGQNTVNPSLFLARQTDADSYGGKTPSPRTSPTVRKSLEAVRRRRPEPCLESARYKDSRGRLVSSGEPPPICSLHDVNEKAPHRHIPVPDRDEPPVNVYSTNSMGQCSPPLFSSGEPFRGESSTENESSDEDGLLYLGRVTRPGKSYMNK